MDVGIVEKIVKSMPEACMASITSPEHGAQQECSSTFLCPPGKASGLRSVVDAMRRLHELRPGSPDWVTRDYRPRFGFMKMDMFSWCHEQYS